MTQPPSAAAPDKDAPVDPVTARIVLRLDDAISAFLAGRKTGLRSLDSARGLMSDLTDEQVMSEAERWASLKRVARRPDRVELAILTVLADTIGERFSRSSPRWRPFASENLSPESQRYAVRALRAAFTWLVDVPYLAGNPWKAINDPKIVQHESAMQIHRALPADLWRRLRHELDKRADEKSDAKLALQWRVDRAALLLMGDSGLRREEVADAQRGKLRVSMYGTLERPVRELTVIGKRKKERTVPVSVATLEALKAHWLNRGRDFMAPTDLLNPSAPLLSPVAIPRTPASKVKHHQRGAEGEQGYSADGINRLISRMLTIIVETMDDLSLDERAILGSVNAHAMRHTFGTQSVADEVPVDVVQKVLGHASLQTTSIYVQAEKKRVLEEVAGYYARRADAAEIGKRGN